ncbi:hypothetical protein [Ruegeria sp. A3M17]|uniref:hypothetical protein n=1 Tax=Ruegeria sp. A3M17 TaxID=2267229 RepID=UPI000DEB13A5|nr:hypothetical protein [Ruegeria sp. A3M17]RBW61795.1 hypothetical protein DS906_04405 [Ruegeria sp. A3M17]
MTLDVRPVASPWKLAKRLALVVFISCFVCNAVLWTIIYLELFGTRCEFICPQSVSELIVAIGMWGLFASAFAVPAATIVMAPLILLAYDVLSTQMSETRAFLLAILTSVLVVLFIGSFLIVGANGVPVSLRPLVTLFPVVFSVLGITSCVALTLLAIEKTLKKRKK